MRLVQCFQIIFFTHPDDFAYSDANADEAEMDLNQHLSEAEKADILRMHGEPKIYAKLVESLAPSVFGHLEVKRGELFM